MMIVFIRIVDLKTKIKIDLPIVSKLFLLQICFYYIIFYKLFSTTGEYFSNENLSHNSILHANWLPSKNSHLFCASLHSLYINYQIYYIVHGPFVIGSRHRFDLWELSI